MKTPLLLACARRYCHQMKKNYRRIGILVCPLAASALLSSCIIPMNTDDHYGTAGGGYSVHTSLPTSFVGSAYYHDGRYYSGGRYQTGRYVYGGRPYSSRYHYNGQYIYGGEYQQYDDSGHRLGSRDSDTRRTYSR